MSKSIEIFIEWCKEHNKKPCLYTSLAEYNAERGFKSKYANKEVLVYADGSIELV